jgi:hypothetical protein
MMIAGPILDTFTVSRDVVGTSCDVSEGCVSMGLHHLQGPVDLPPRL